MTLLLVSTIGFAWGGGGGGPAPTGLSAWSGYSGCDQVECPRDFSALVWASIITDSIMRIFRG